MEPICENIYRIRIQLPRSPLKNLNCYVIRDENGRDLVIDTGFNIPECEEQLLNGLRELGTSVNECDLFITHMHSDHMGLAGLFMEAGCTLYMSRTESELISGDIREMWKKMDRVTLREGFPEELIRNMSKQNPARAYAPRKQFTRVTLRDGETISYGGHTLTCIETPGHTPGQMCLYDAKNRVMFLADHVLFDITPNITAWTTWGEGDSLGDYLRSLDKIAAYPVDVPLPAHRDVSCTMLERIEQLRKHHDARLEEVFSAVKNHPGNTAYDLARYVTWRIRAKSWEEFPLAQQWFATGEITAHLDHLRVMGKIRSEDDENGIRHYWTAMV